MTVGIHILCVLREGKVRVNFNLTLEIGWTLSKDIYLSLGFQVYFPSKA
jgi:hypothetical protein